MQNVKVIWKKVANLIAGRDKGPGASTPDPFMRRSAGIPGRDAQMQPSGTREQQPEPSWKSANAVPNQSPQTLYC